MNEQAKVRFEGGFDATSEANRLLRDIHSLFDIEGQLFRSNFEQLCRLGGKSLAEYGDRSLTDRVLAVHKFLFLTGGDEADVITAKDYWGNHIYTKLFHGESPPNQEDPRFREYYPVKEGEIQEANSEISSFIQRVRSVADAEGIKHWQIDLRRFLEPMELPEVLSEVSDIVYNLLNVARLDRNLNYESHVQAIAEALGYTAEDLLHLVKVKYFYRYVTVKGKKNIEEENRLIAQEISANRLPIPSIGQLSLAYNEINNIDRTIIQTRLIQLRTEVNRNLRRSKK